MEKKNHDAPNTAARAQGPQARVPSSHPRWLCNPLKSPLVPTNPFAGVSLRVKGSRSWRDEAGGKGLRTHVRVYTYCGGEVAELWTEPAWTSWWLDRAGDRCPWCVLAPTNLGNSLTLDGSQARNDGGARRRARAAVDETLPLIHGGRGLYRELVLEICLGKDKQMRVH